MFYPRKLSSLLATFRSASSLLRSCSSRGSATSLSRVLAIAGVLAMIPGLARADEVVLPEGCERGFIPWSPSKPLHVDGDPALLPRAAGDFIALEGTEWSIFYDEALDSPRFLAPLDPSRALGGVPLKISLVEGDPNLAPEATSIAAREFLLAHGEFFGLAPEDLCAGASTSYLAGGLLVVFAQCLAVEAPADEGEGPVDELPLRGAAARVLVNSGGELVFVKSYLARSPNARFASVLPKLVEWRDAASVRAQALAEAPVVEGEGEGGVAAEGPSNRGEVLSLRAEIGFFDSEEPVALWRLELADARGYVREELRDARSGALLSRCEDVKHFTSRPDAYAADFEDPFAWREDILPDPQEISATLLFEGERSFNGKVEHGIEVSGCSDDGVTLVAPPEVFALDIRWLLASSTVAPDDCGLIGAFVPTHTPQGQANLPVRFEAPCPEFFVQPGYLVNADMPPVPIDNGFGLRTLIAPHPCIGENSSIWSRSYTLTEFETRAITFNRTIEIFDIHPDSRERFRAAVSGWIHEYAHVEKVFRAVRRAVESELADRERFDTLRLSPYEDFQDLGIYLGPPTLHRRADGTREIFYYSTARGPRTGELYRVQATIIAHEAGHHLLEEIIGVSLNSHVHEALADVLSAYAIEEPRIGYQKIAGGEIVRGPVGRHLGERETEHGGAPESIAEEFRVAVAQGWWRFFVLNQPDGDLEQRRPWNLLARWLGTNVQVEQTPQLSVEDVVALPEELLAILGNGLVDNEDPDDLRLARARILLAFSDPPFGVRTPFLRGDSDLDGQHTISDAVVILTFLFGGVARLRNCRDAYDANDSSEIDISDALAVLHHLFVSGAPLPAPYPDCGFDPTPDTHHCGEFSCAR